uniref:G6PI n=1 Tax=Arundo donax TaxID=35708 RepID=A0A0A9GW45_ARUDO
MQLSLHQFIARVHKNSKNSMFPHAAPGSFIYFMIYLPLFLSFS